MTTIDGSVHTGPAPATAPPPPRWAIVCAWAAALTPLPSALWRVTGAFGADGTLRAFLHEGWYLVLLSVASLGLSVLALGLVRPWGLVYPRWIPLLAGRPVSAKRAALAAYTGAGTVMLLLGYGLWNHYFGHLQPFEPLISDGTVHPQPDGDIMSLYLPMLAWGPLLIAVAADYSRRTARKG
ncbi:hypothetical protein AB0I28_05905 [Phytomonospora sp. NPDC050363]|uniref:hypothetical protein n=1 Tax=Phytomonospora sp. NPDC050363 TaxID=3155642 RepID=UPI0033DBEE55